MTQAQRTSHTCRLAPHSPLPSLPKHAHTDTHDATSPTHHNTTSASRRVSPTIAHTNKPRAAHRTLARSIHTPAQHARTTSRATATAMHCANITTRYTKLYCPHTAARTPHTPRHTALRTSHTAHRKSHPVTHAASAPHSHQSCQAAQRRRDAAGELVVVQVQLPAGHTNSHRVTPWHPTPTPTPASRPQRISAHRIAPIKPNE
jgi:hypothetical protein